MKLLKKSKIGFLACVLLVFSIIISPLQVDASGKPVGNASLETQKKFIRQQIQTMYGQSLT